MIGRFTGKVALVTGATRGIGAATARRLAGEGAAVVICGRSEDDGAAIVRELGGEERALFVRADLRQVADCYAAVDRAVERFGRLDILVNNAASVARGTLETTTPDDFDAMLALNLRAPFLTMQRALPTMQAQFAREGAGGVMINIGSVNAYIGDKKLAAYSASKGGLMTLSRNLAAALGPWRIRVHVLNIGWTLTEGEVVVQREEGKPEDWAEQAGAGMPWGRLLLPEEIAGAVAYFASDEARVFSGVTAALEQRPF
jgi:NAD(P)-dependent dehydrogenase (short-subunit alcohol dehydrogenase family)